MLIGITGPAGAGKSEVAAVLVREAKFERVKFADPLKNMLRTILRDIGHTDDDVERYIEGNLKEQEVDGIGITARRLMQTLGTEWGRSLDENFWIRLWAARAECFDHVVVDDVRFPNEVEAVRERGGEIWRIERPGASLIASTHISEQLDCQPDRIIVNDGDLDLLRYRVRTAWLFAPVSHPVGWGMQDAAE